MSLQPEEVKVRDLQLLVGMRKKAWEETQRKMREVEERKKAQERQQWEERERLRRMVEEKTQREARLERIRNEQEQALRKEKERKASEEVEVSHDCFFSLSICCDLLDCCMYALISMYRDLQ